MNVRGAVAVIFTSELTDDLDGYAEAGARMEALAATQPGYLAFESARTPGGLGISVSYWRDLACARAWHAHPEHQAAISAGQDRWYAWYTVRVCTVDRDYGQPAPARPV